MTKLRPEFVISAPDDLEEGVLYISREFSTTLHKCACGCGNEVVLPLSPVDWELEIKNGLASMSPSVGNWDYPCQSHYWITDNKIIWAPKWSPEKIAIGRQRDAEKKATYYQARQHHYLWAKFTSWVRHLLCRK